MKLLNILFLILFILPQAIYAQFNLEVEGDIQVSDSSPTINLFDSVENRTAASIGESNSDLRIINGYGHINFFTANNNLLSQRVTIQNATGNVGIGTNSPLRKLDVNGELWMRDDVTIDAADLVLRSSNNNSFRIRTDNSGDLSFVGDGSVTHMKLTDQLGYLGLGTITPQAKLHIVGGSDASPTGGGFIVLGDEGAANLSIDNNEIMARNNDEVANMYIQNNGGDLLLCASEQGAVGIGVLNAVNIPAGYLLAVDGKVIAEEVLVELSGSWPDYVFEEEYDLLPIDELEKSIEVNGHLPGIPSAQEVESEGILLGDMQKMMMEKIEELSLYIIQLNDENKTLRSDFIRLNKQFIDATKNQ